MIQKKKTFFLSIFDIMCDLWYRKKACLSSKFVIHRTETKVFCLDIFYPLYRDIIHISRKNFIVMIPSNGKKMSGNFFSARVKMKKKTLEATQNPVQKLIFRREDYSTSLSLKNFCHTKNIHNNESYENVWTNFL